MTERFLLRVLIVMNTLGLLGYLAWLMYGREWILYTQGGVLFLLPCLPFFFVLVYVLRRTAKDKESE